MKFIHCSDLHLDSRMESNLSYQQAQERNNEICTTFARMVAYAKKEEIPVVLIAGDLFDTDRISARTGGYVLDLIEQAPDVDFLYLKGNHDESSRAFVGRELPENLKLFAQDWTYYQYDDVTIAGIELSKTNYKTFYNRLTLDPNRTNIVLMHGQVSTQTGEECVCLPNLRNRNIHYLALGHLHSYQKETLDLTGSYCYCGCLEGRGFDECGEKGFVLGETGSQTVQTKFVPFACRTLYNINVDISGLNSVSKMIRAMKTASKDVSSKSLVKFTLTGSYTLDTQKDLPFLLKSLESKFYFVKIKDESTLKIEKETYENDISLKGEFVRRVMQSPLSQEEKDLIICAGIQALSGEDIAL